MTSSTTQQPAAPAGDGPLTDARTTFAFSRSPVDVLHALVAAAILLLLVASTKAFPTTLAAIQVDLVAAFTRLPRWLDGAVLVVLQLLTLIGQIGLLVFLLRRRNRGILLRVVIAIVAAPVVFAIIDRWIATAPPAALDVALPGPVLGGEAWPSTAWLSGVAAALMVATTVMPRRWKQASWGLYVLLVGSRLVTGSSLTIDVAVAALLGITIGAVVLLALGRPDVRPTLAEVTAALASLSVPSPVVTPASVDARGSTPYFATDADGRRVFAKVLTTQERYADIVFRTYRRVRFRELGDEKPFSSLRRAVEHEAMLSLMAADVGVRTPRLVGLAEVGGFDALLLAYEGIDGRSLDSVPVERITDAVLQETWDAVARLHARQITHRDLRLANVFLDDDDRVWMIDFGFGEAACSPGQRHGDIAELLASSAAVVGPERAVAAARTAIDDDELIAASARLEPMALSTATRTAIKKADQGLDALRDELARATGRAVDEPEELERVKPRTLVTLVLLGAAVYFLLPQLADLPGLFQQIRDVELPWVLPVVVASLATYVGAALGLVSAVPQRVPFLPALGVSLAGSFVNRLAPVKVAGTAINVRFLQKRGVEPLTAIAAAGLIALAGGISHLAVTGTALVLAGKQSEGLPFKLPNTYVLIGIATAILIVIGIVLWIPRTAKILREKVLPAVKSTRDSLRELTTRPRKLIGLFAGGILVPVSYSLCLYCSVEAFGGGLNAAQVAVVFLTIGTIASAAPTPGGVGAVEAGLIGGLTAVGLPAEQALASVFLYRLATFWFPVLPGWGSFTALQRSGSL